MRQRQIRAEFDTPPARGNLTRADWLEAARRILVNEGISRITLRRLSNDLGVTTGAFYWLFRNLDELQADLLKDWKIRNNAEFEKIFAGDIEDWRKTYLKYVKTIILESRYDPQYDNAVRSWARTSEMARRALTEIDAVRIGQLKKFFEALGFEGRRAEVRAHNMYYHQSSYFELDEDETLDERLANVPYYAELLTGHSLFADPDNIEATRRVLEEA